MSQETSGRTDTRDIIRAFLEEHEHGVHEFRLQKLIYLLELVLAQENERATDLDYKPYMYGSYSEELGDELEKMKRDTNLTTKADYQHGKVTTKYFPSGEEPDIEEDLREKIKKISSEVDMKNEDLGQWSKETKLYKETEYGTEMNFNDFSEEDFEEDVLEHFPEIVDS